MKKHRWFLSEDAAEVFCSCTKRQQRKLLVALRFIAQFPHQEADATINVAQRKSPASAKVFDEWQIIWWVDEPVWEIQILEIRAAMH